MTDTSVRIDGSVQPSHYRGIRMTQAFRIALSKGHLKSATMLLKSGEKIPAIVGLGWDGVGIVSVIVKGRRGVSALVDASDIAAYITYDSAATKEAGVISSPPEEPAAEAESVPPPEE